MSSAAPQAAKRPAQSRRSVAEFRPAWESISRGVSIFWGLFLLSQVFLWGDSFSTWWLGELPFPLQAQRGASAFYAVLLLVYGFTEKEPKLLRTLTWITTGLLLGFSLLQVWNWYAAKEAGMIDSPVNVPFVLQVTGVLSVIFAGLSQPANVERSRQGGLLLAIIAFDVCLITIPIAHIYCLGQTSDAVPSQTILLTIDELSEPTPQSALNLSRYFSSEGPTQLFLIGESEQTSAWKKSLDPLEQDYDLRVSTSQELNAAQQTLQGYLKKVSDAQQSSSVLIVGTPTEISSLRIRVLRAGLKPRQLVMDRELLTVESAAREIPDLWLSYLPLRKQDRL